ncbi:MAG: hypothetical protein GF398_21515 [Chitinivibrionales bacterium]|nr:hypothetical protein [Chitinivibrionales bacterium]
MKLFTFIPVTIFSVLLSTVHSADSVDATNDFYDNEKTHHLKVNPVTVSGEIDHPGKVDFTLLPLRTVIVKEAILDKGKDAFVGAYRYDGYSLYDILNTRTLHKKNANAFKPIIDAFIVVENDAGDEVVISWGELFYPVNPHQILIATQVMRIVPSRTRELWPLPEKARLICAHDLLTERNIANPVTITVRSSEKQFKVRKGLKPLYADTFSIYRGDSLVEAVAQKPGFVQEFSYDNVFYGRGKGIHGISTFTGIALKEILLPHFPIASSRLSSGYFVVAAADGYRGVFTYSEIANRNDQSETLLVTTRKGEHEGRFKLYPAGDFFSDRAIKAVTGIYYFE